MQRVDGEQTYACEMLSGSSREKKASSTSCIAHASLHGNEDKQACWAAPIQRLKWAPKKDFKIKKEGLNLLIKLARKSGLGHRGNGP